jgi:hypothetical protein
MHEAMDPIMAKVGNHEIAQHTGHEWHGKDHVRQLGRDGDVSINVACQRKDNKLKNDKGRQIVQDHLTIGHLSRRAPELNRCDPDQSPEEQQWEKQIVIEKKSAKFTTEQPLNPFHPIPS